MSQSDKPEGTERDAQDRVVSALARRALSRKNGALPTASDLDDDTLLRYFDGSLPSAERDALERRLLVDLDAKERLAILVGAFDESGVPRPVVAQSSVERAVQAVARTVFYVGAGMLELLRGGENARELQPAAVRGATGDTRPSAFQIDRLFHTASGPLSARFELHSERPESTQPPLVDLVVHVDVGGSPIEGIRCKLIRDGRPIDSREVEQAGCTFSRLGPARYDIELRKGGVEIGRALFDLRG